MSGVWLKLATALLLVSVVTSLDVSSLQGRSVFEVILGVAKQHPEEVERTIQGFTSHVISDVDARSRYTRDLTSALFDPATYAMDGVCTVCRVLLSFLRFVLDNSDDHDAVMDTVYEYCYFLFQAIDQQLDGREICKTVYIQGPDVAFIVQQTSNLPPAPSIEDFCRYLNACFEVPSAERVLMGPHRPNMAEAWPSLVRERFRHQRRLLLEARKKNAIKIAQLTDIHIEKDYAAGTLENCGLYVCCLERQGPGTSSPHGSFRCNIPERTGQLFIDEVVSHSPDFIIFSGDIPPHTVWEETEESQLECTERLTRMMEQSVGDRPVYSTIGNHEMYPTNLFSFRFNNHTGSMVARFAELWERLSGLTDEQKETMNEGGYYTIMSPFPGLRILTINNVYMYSNNFYNVLNYQIVSVLPPRFGEAEVMKNNVRTILQDARTNGEKVIIVTHHALGNGDFVVSESHWWEELISEFFDVIVLQVAGHTHTDEFRLIKSSDNEVKSMMYINPSVDMHGRVNPSMRIYFLDPDTYEVIDYEQHYFHLPAYPDDSTVPEIRLLYSAMDEYQLDDMSPASWQNLLARFETDNALLLRHLKHSYADSGRETTVCNDSCRRRHVCRQLHSTYDHYQVCVDGPAPEPTSTLSKTWPTLTTPGRRNQ